MTLTDLFISWSVIIPIAGSVVEGWQSGVTGIFTGLAIGIGFAVVGFVGVRAVIKRAPLNPVLGKGATLFWRFVSSIQPIPVLLWIFVNGMLAILITRSFVHHVAA